MLELVDILFTLEHTRFSSYCKLDGTNPLNQAFQTHEVLCQFLLSNFLYPNIYPVPDF